MDHSEVVNVGNAIFSGIRDMDSECPTGLCNYVSCSPYAGKKRKDEAAIIWGVTKVLQRRWVIEQQEHRYPQSRSRCDRVLELSGGGKLWIEVKLAWWSWFYERVKFNEPFMYNGYFTGAHHAHSVVGDIEKLDALTRECGRYAGLLIIGFDSGEGRIANDMATLVETKGLEARTWRLLEDSWQTRQSLDCWIRCWLLWREPGT